MTNTPTASALGTSEQQLMDAVYRLADAGGSIIQIRSREVMRTMTTLRKSIIADDANMYREWDQVNGWRTFTLENFSEHKLAGDNSLDYDSALMQPLVELRTANSPVNSNATKMHYFAYVDYHTFITGNPRGVAMLQQYAAVLPSKNVCIFLITPENNLSDLPLGTVLSVDAPTPTAEELEACLRRLVDASAKELNAPHEIEDEEFHLISHLGLGMTRYEFETYASIAIVEAGQAGEDSISAEALINGISKGKTEVVKQSDILELFPTEDMSEVGGMQRLKDWIDNRADAFSDEAKEFGVEAPKGIAIVGVPGTGKSLIAKAIASKLNCPLLRLDFGRVFSKFIGDSEQRMRAALKMVESMGHLVLFADEIDKGLGGIGQGGGDSGTSSRVLGAFLTWMQENTSKCFVIVTANKIDGLPPELFRKGRLDQVFSVGLPSAQEREEVLAVHLRKRGRDIKTFTRKELDQFRQASEGRVPAEIEACVKDGLVNAYNDKKVDDLEMSHLIEALEESIPMSRSHKAQIDKIIEWAAANATPVNYEEEEALVVPAEEASRLRRPIRRV
jgi:ATP-dependent 26S proteasome regulatory subunit